MTETADIVVVTKPGVSALPASVRQVAASFEADLRPQFAGTSEPTLSTFWSETAPIAHAADLITRLLALPEVEGAYLKPPDSAP